MQKTTQEAVAAVLRGDPTVTAQDRTQIIAVLRDHGCANPSANITREPRIMRRKQTAERLGRTTRFVDNLAREGILTRIILKGRKRAAGFRESEVNALIGGGV